MVAMQDAQSQQPQPQSQPQPQPQQGEVKQPNPSAAGCEEPQATGTKLTESGAKQPEPRDPSSPVQQRALERVNMLKNQAKGGKIKSETKATLSSSSSSSCSSTTLRTATTATKVNMPRPPSKGVGVTEVKYELSNYLATSLLRDALYSSLDVSGSGSAQNSFSRPKRRAAADANNKFNIQ